MNNRQSLLISLSEPINILKNGFSDYVEMIIFDKNIQYQHKPIPAHNVKNYNCIPFFMDLLADIFGGYKFDDVDGLPLSTKVLVDDGMDVEYARTLALKVFKSTIATISNFIPDVDFNEDGYRYSLYNEYDLLIEPPYRDSIDDKY